jgi:omega-hydroxy-beta-dihydromenaquinone-9 sulfotransferase
MNQVSIRPVFVIGTGRSGSTVFFEVFARHPNVAWLSSLAHRYPQQPALNDLLMRLRGSSLIDRLLGGRFGPSEAYPFCNCPGFSNPYRDLQAEDVTPGAAANIRQAIARTITASRPHFVAKITGWPRVRYLRELFPNALFIEVTRNPCATVSSLLEVPFWDGWRGPPNWRRGRLPDDLGEIWKQEGESFTALAAIEYVIVQRAMALCRESLPAAQWHSVSYSDFCSDPVTVFRKVVEFCQLNWSARFERLVRSFHLVDRDGQWRKRLTTAQQDTLKRTLEKARALPRGESHSE